MERPTGSAIRKSNLALVPISPEAILKLLCVPKEYKYKTNSVHHDFNSDMFLITLEHTDSPLGYEGELIPKLDILYPRGCLSCGRPMFEYKIPE